MQNPCLDNIPIEFPNLCWWSCPTIQYTQKLRSEKKIGMSAWALTFLKHAFLGSVRPFPFCKDFWHLDLTTQMTHTYFIKDFREALIMSQNNNEKKENRQNSWIQGYSCPCREAKNKERSMTFLYRMHWCQKDGFSALEWKYLVWKKFLSIFRTPVDEADEAHKIPKVLLGENDRNVSMRFWNHKSDFFAFSKVMSVL